MGESRRRKLGGVSDEGHAQPTATTTTMPGYGLFGVLANELITFFSVRMSHESEIIPH